jgi:putative ABC transport system permease protein
MIETLWQDFRFGARMLIRKPGFTVVVVLTLALGIGGSTAIFSFVNGVLLSPLPFPEPDRLVVVCETHPDRPGGWCGASPANQADWREQSVTLAELGLGRTWGFSLQQEGESAGVRGGIATPGLFEVFGVRPSLGRTFEPKDTEPGNEKIAVVSYRFWQDRLGGQADIVGQPITLDKEPHVVVGVLPEGFGVQDLEGVEVWIPLWPERTGFRGWRGFRSYARLAAGVSLPEAQAEMATIRGRLAESYPEDNEAWGVQVDSLHDRVVRSVRPALLVFLGAVGFVLLIACANVANLFLVHATGREKEFAVRAAMGASPWHLVRQLLTESVLLAFLGGTFGLLLAVWAVDGFIALSPGNIPRLEKVQIDGGVLGFLFLLTLGTSVLFGLAPAWQWRKPDIQESLKEGRQSSARGASARLRNGLIVGEIALALVLLTGAGLLLRSFSNLLDWQPGFDPENLVMVQVFHSPGKYPQAQMVADLYERSVEELNSIPAVVSAGAASAIPLYGGDGEQEFLIEGRPVPPAGERPTVAWFDAGPNYFRTVGIPLQRGRFFTSQDTQETPRVVIINETMARRHWPNEDPVGQRLTLLTHEMTAEVVGVVGDVQPFNPEEAPGPQLYWPYKQIPRWVIVFAVRTGMDASAVLPEIRARLEAIDPDTEIWNTNTMEQLVGRELVRPRFNLLLIGLFAMLAVLIAAVGLYGVISYTVLGLGGAYVLTRLLVSLLVQVTPTDPVTFAATAALLAMIALLACYVPARRAARVDPMIALRYE